MRKLAAVLLMSFLAAPAIAAGEDAHGGKSQGAVVLLPPPSGSLHLPGREYRSGSGWWAISCRAACELTALKLDVSAKPHARYDGEPVPGQVLAFSPAPPATTLLIMKPLRAPADGLDLQAGPVTTWFPGSLSKLKRSTLTEGTMEGELALPDGRAMRFVPTTTTTSEPHMTGSELSLELVFDGKRQNLGTFHFGIEGLLAMKPSEYVLWAGDLDRDGKPDLILKLGFDGSTQRVLFLSSLAKAGEIVGQAGNFNYFPIEESGC